MLPEAAALWLDMRWQFGPKILSQTCVQIRAIIRGCRLELEALTWNLDPIWNDNIERLPPESEHSTHALPSKLAWIDLVENHRITLLDEFFWITIINDLGVVLCCSFLYFTICWHLTSLHRPAFLSFLRAALAPRSSPWLVSWYLTKYVRILVCDEDCVGDRRPWSLWPAPPPPPWSLTVMLLTGVWNSIHRISLSLLFTRWIVFSFLLVIVWNIVLPF